MSDNQNNIPEMENENLPEVDNTDLSTKENTSIPNDTPSPVGESANTEVTEEHTTSALDEQANDIETDTTVEDESNTAVEGESVTEAEPTPEPEGERSPTDEVEKSEGETYAFEWNYTTINENPPTAKPRKKKTGLIFGLVASGVFLVAILALVAAVILGSKNGSFNASTSNNAPTVDFNTQINVSDGTEIGEDKEPEATPNLIEQFKNSTVVVYCDSGTGTGIILDDNGMIVTNYHVVEDATSINVYLYDGRSYSATYIGGDEYNDIAVIKISADNLVPATFADSSSAYVGQKVYAVGTPAGLDFAWSVSAGIVSHPYRELKFHTDDGLLERSLFLIQTDALVNPGNSGGPLVNANCEVLGIVTIRLSDTYVGMGFAIPTNVALPIIEKIITGYKEPSKIPSNTPQLGIKGIVVEKDELFIMTSMGFKELVTEDYYKRYPDRCQKAAVAGIYVLEVTEGFDAAGKLKAGDIIIGADGKPVNTMDGLKSAITRKSVGDTLKITVERNGQQYTYDIVLGKAVS